MVCIVKSPNKLYHSSLIVVRVNLLLASNRGLFNDILFPTPVHSTSAFSFFYVYQVLRFYLYFKLIFVRYFCYQSCIEYALLLGLSYLIALKVRFCFVCISAINKHPIRTCTCTLICNIKQ